jgi:esterase/lipase
MLSNTIKQDSLDFYDYLLSSGRSVEDVYVMGRSIGSGGASYLGGHRNVPVLVLMSPFDNIKSVAMGLVGCMGCIVKQHFNN